MQVIEVLLIAAINVTFVVLQSATTDSFLRFTSPQYAQARVENSSHAEATEMGDQPPPIGF